MRTYRAGVAILVALCACGGGQGARRGTGTDAAWDGSGPEPDWGTTYYVRSDGGNVDQCDGTANVSYPGSGTGLRCAWQHPFFALPPGGRPRIAGGDRLIIGPGAYRMGLGAPGADGCDASDPWDCTAAAIPSGPDAEHPTRIVGAGYDTGCASPPTLHGVERASHVLSLVKTRHARVECLEITDFAPCVEHHPTIPCERDSAPFGEWAADGILAVDAAAITLRHLNIHGLATAGVRAGRLADIVLEDVRIAANGWVGWEGDLGEPSSNSGTLRFTRVVVEWNGCGENQGKPTGCWGQSAGGYGDGLGTATTAGDWIFESSSFLHNTSDGLDLLYLQGGTVRIDGMRAEGNAGNQIKTRGPATITNSVVVGNCGYFRGKPFSHQVDDCRAMGNAISLEMGAGDRVVLANNTVYSEGDCLIVAESERCSGAARLWARNNVFLGGRDFLQPAERSCLVYSGCQSISQDMDYNAIHGVKESPCPVGSSDRCTDPLLEDSRPESFNGRLKPGSPARESGLSVGGDIPARDIDGKSRPVGGGVDRGAYEQ
ncbi:MAG: hypothetical protein HY698_10955 [Deltaproteobacteria bacterium]|nr:hypothetical protein [Deltaproteobacteria bacterium]